MAYRKVKAWDGKDVDEPLTISLKIDGVRALRSPDGSWLSRNGKPLYGLDHLPPKYNDVEVYKDNWSTSVSLCRRIKADPIPEEYIYSLDPVDIRLHPTKFKKLSSKSLHSMLYVANIDGYEGIVFTTENGIYKIKPRPSHDVKVTGLVEGTGRNLGRLGAFETELGKVGTGFSDADRELYWSEGVNCIGKIIEVECMGLTDNNKFRHPRFLRERWDK